MSNTTTEIFHMSAELAFHDVKTARAFVAMIESGGATCRVTATGYWLDTRDGETFNAPDYFTVDLGKRGDRITLSDPDRGYKYRCSPAEGVTSEWHKPLLRVEVSK